MNKWIKNILRKPYFLFRIFFFNPLEVINKVRALPIFIRNQFRYHRLNRDKSFRIRLGDIYYASYDRYSTAGMASGHYFHQDIWAAKILYDSRIKKHVDVGSRIDGFIGHILPFCQVSYVDMRPLGAKVQRLEFRQGSILQLPFPDNSVPSLSCLHVIEHIGLGRYGDPVDPDGYLHAAAELSRVLMPDGKLLLGTPVGRQRLCFDAHRIFDPETILRVFGALHLVEFSLIDDSGKHVIRNASMEQAQQCNYGCGLFVFEK